jgi:hypothetical protein
MAALKGLQATEKKPAGFSKVRWIPLQIKQVAQTLNNIKILLTTSRYTLRKTGSGIHH